jgi:putative solute:sodium symporter small subunit
MSTDTSNREEHWRRTKKLMMITLSIWFIFSFVVHWFAPELNAVNMIGGWPLGFYMAAQGSEAVFVITLFWFVKAQHKIDRECGFAEED